MSTNRKVAPPHAHAQSLKSDRIVRATLAESVGGIPLTETWTSSNWGRWNQLARRAAATRSSGLASVRTPPELVIGFDPTPDQGEMSGRDLSYQQAQDQMA